MSAFFPPVFLRTWNTTSKVAMTPKPLQSPLSSSSLVCAQFCTRHSQIPKCGENTEFLSSLF